MGTIRKASIEDFQFVFKSVTLLLDREIYNADRFKSYYIELINTNSNTHIWIYVENGIDKGCIVANKFSITRYLGYGVELEEIVVLSEFQNQGVGKKFIEQLVDHYKQDSLCRKVIIKTDDQQGSGKLYGRIFEHTGLKTYQKFINKL